MTRAASGSSVPSSAGGISASFYERTVPVTLRYAHGSSASTRGDNATLRFATNWAREAVSFDGELVDPVPFREALSALHAIVTRDDRRPPKDRAAYERYVATRRAAEVQAQQQGRDAAAAAAAERLAALGAPPDGAKDAADDARRRYWRLRDKHSRVLQRENPALWRQVMPCDPVVTVGPDAVLFEGFSKDESAWGCVFVDRGAFRSQGDVVQGTTNVDYSQALFDSFQSLRSYRSTRLRFDAGGVDVGTEGAWHREEKIELPARWLKGFAQVSAAALLPSRSVQLPVEVLVAILAHLARHRESHGPRALRFHLVPGRPPRITLEPWGVVVESRGPAYAGEREESIAVWGRRRLQTLSRTLALCQVHGGLVDVQLLGSGLPSIWSVPLPGLRLVLALSGYLKNDFSQSARLDLLATGAVPGPSLVDNVARALARERSITLPRLVAHLQIARQSAVGAVLRLAQLGQAVVDPATGVIHQRAILAAPLADELLGPEPLEVRQGRQLVSNYAVQIRSDVVDPKDGARTVTSRDDQVIVLDADGALVRGTCNCSWHKRSGLKRGPCRHLLALRLIAHQAVQ